MSDSTPSIRVYPRVSSFVDEVGVADSVTRDPGEMIAEINALNSATLAVEHHRDTTLVRHSIREVFVTRLGELDQVEDRGIAAAMAKILGEDPSVFAVEPANTMTWERTVIETVTRAWIDWACGHPQTALLELPHLRNQQHSNQTVEGRRGAVNLMAMYFWLSAVEALALGDTRESKRLWKRALDLGSHFGTESHLLVSWTYAASFFPTH